MRREFKYELYDLFIELPQPLVSRELRFEINERTISTAPCTPASMKRN